MATWQVGVFFEQNRKLILNTFKVLMLVQIGFNLLLRGATSHNFAIPLDEFLGYSFVVVSIVLIILLSIVKNKVRIAVKYAALLALIGVNWIQIHFAIGTLAIQYEDLFTSVFFHLIDVLYIGISIVVFYLIFTYPTPKTDRSM